MNDYNEKERAEEEIEEEEEGEIIMQFQGEKRDQQIATIRQPNKQRNKQKKKEMNVSQTDMFNFCSCKKYSMHFNH